MIEAAAVIFFIACVIVIVYRLIPSDQEHYSGEFAVVLEKLKRLSQCSSGGGKINVTFNKLNKKFSPALKRDIYFFEFRYQRWEKSYGGNKWGGRANHETVVNYNEKYAFAEGRFDVPSISSQWIKDEIREHGYENNPRIAQIEKYFPRGLMEIIFKRDCPPCFFEENTLLISAKDKNDAFVYAEQIIAELER